MAYSCVALLCVVNKNLLIVVYFFLSSKSTHNLSYAGVAFDYTADAIPICRFNKVLECFFYFAHNITPSLVFLDNNGMLQKIKRLMEAI